MKGYRARIIDNEVARALRAAGGLVIEGPRGCGKTATGRHHAASEVLLDTDDSSRNLAIIDPTAVLAGATPRLIDEWQVVPGIWNHVRRIIDDRQTSGQFILTGSAAPADDITRHSGAGRLLRLRMRPMSLFESGKSSGELSITQLMGGNATNSVEVDVPLSIADVAELVCHGGWPGMQNNNADEANLLLTSYLDDAARIDIPDLAGSRRDPQRIRRLIKSLARRSASEVANSTIAYDASSHGEPMRPETASSYLDLLERIFLVEPQPSWGPHLRSRDIVRKKPKFHFTDPALAAAGLGTNSQQLATDPKTLGLLFESLVIRDLRIYSQQLGGSVSHYRDSADLEVDAIVQSRDGSWIAVEVKLGLNGIDAGAESLKKFAGKLDLKVTPAPTEMVVITVGKYAYRRPDGVLVIPLNALGP